MGKAAIGDSSSLNDLENNATLSSYASRLCHQLNNSKRFNGCVDYLTATFEREEDVYAILIVQLIFSSVGILLNGIVLVALRLKPNRKKVDRLQEGDYYFCLPSHSTETFKFQRMLHFAQLQTISDHQFSLE
ncbi:hypothetical protein M514_01537, partial [Trichuris suis]